MGAKLRLITSKDLRMLIIEGHEPSPVGTIYGIGRNYLDHAKELGNQAPDNEPVVFLKAPSSVRGLTTGGVAFDGIGIHYEAEVVIRVGKKTEVGSKNVTWHAVDAVGLGLDLTHREKQNQLKAKGLPWALAKSFTGSTILTPMVPTSQLKGQSYFSFDFFIDDQLRQQGDTSKMIFSVPEILTFLATTNTLYPGDIVFTGTPAGVGTITKGQKFRLVLTEPHRSWEGQL